MNWLITGGCGFIGTSLIAALKRRTPDLKVRVLDDLSVGGREDLARAADFSEVKVSEIAGGPSGVELATGDVRDRDTALACCRGIDIVVHLAAQTGVPQSVEDPWGDMTSNVGGTLTMLEGARLNRVGRFVFASSNAAVGEAPMPIHEERVPRPVSPYGAAKLAGEAYCQAYCRTFGLKTVSLRFANVYGPRSKYKSSVVAKFIKRALEGQVLEIYGDGNQTRDFLYIDDLVEAIILSSKIELGGEVFQIATQRETTINALTRMLAGQLAQLTGKEPEAAQAPRRAGDVIRNFSDITKAREILGWEPKTRLDQGLGQTIKYFLYGC